ncbi:hypothetical protein CPB84DRAFT_1851040 [Gymnopilus junonius]|uniref:Uncharacterized protein n=1 Tax=Gymnopilus junonius TaxID=109634 RepID=A0A9P5NH45_GYMJU|nr:hypothetical protein CPB84DRAFT_1851040 [Gymnopilus junonius]
MLIAFYTLTTSLLTFFNQSPSPPPSPSSPSSLASPCTPSSSSSTHISILSTLTPTHTPSPSTIPKSWPWLIHTSDIYLAHAHNHPYFNALLLTGMFGYYLVYWRYHQMWVRRRLRAGRRLV